MKLCLFLFASVLVFAADWSAVQRIPATQRIEVTERSGEDRHVIPSPLFKKSARPCRSCGGQQPA